MSTASDGDQGFFSFYREYAHTGIHTITATALTAFGLLTFVHQGFVALAIGVYVLPPIVLYLTRDQAPEPVDGEEEADEPSSATEPTNGRTGTDADAGVDVPPASGANGRNEASEGLDDQGATTSGEATADSGVSDREPAGTGAGSSPAGDEPAEPSSADTNYQDGPEEGSEPTPAVGVGADERSGTAGGATPESSAEGAVEGEGGLADTEGDEEDESEEAEKEEDGPAEWIEADSPTDETLLDAVSADGNAYAAGKNGVLLARSGEEWEVALESGPAAESTTLRGVDATADGEAVWVAGDGGVLGRYDSTTTRHTDYSAPEGITDNWSGLAVAGAAGEERVALVNGSGQVLFGEYDGSEVEWNEPVKPGSGSSMSAISFLDESLGYCCDTNAGVYRIEGSEFERLGIENASGFDALAATDDVVAVASDDGTLQRFDGSVWTPVRVAEGALNGLATDGNEWLAVGAGGAIHESREGDWEAVDSPTEAELFGVVADEVPVAVGADGTVVERR